MKKEEKQHRK